MGHDGLGLPAYDELESLLGVVAPGAVLEALTLTFVAS